MSRKKIIFILIIVLIVSGASFYFLGGEEDDRSQEIDPRELIDVSRGTLKQTVSADGSLEAVRKQDYMARSDGQKVEAVHVSEGDWIEKGDILIELDNRQQRLNYLQAEQALEMVKISGTQREIEEKELELDVAEEELEDQIIEAGFSGIVTDVEVEEGDYAFSADTLVTVMDLSGFLVDIEIDESDSSLLEIGQDVIIELDAFTGQEFAGQLTEIKQRARYENGVSVLPGTVTVKESNPDFRPGYSADLEIIVDREEDQILVPVTALVTEEGQDYVFRWVDEQLQAVEVETSLSDGLQIVVTEGLNEDEKILVNVYQQAGLLEDEGPEFGFSAGPPRGGF